MTIHDKARQMVRQSAAPMSLERAYQILGRRGASQRRKNHGVLHVTNTDRQSVAAIERPAYWWQDKD